MKDRTPGFNDGGKLPDSEKRKDFFLALDQALRFLGRQSLSQKELEQKLLKKNIPSGLVRELGRHCLEKGYLNEEERASQIVRSCLRSGYGPLRVRRELEKRGIPQSLIEKILGNIFEEEEEGALLKSAALKKLAVLSEKDPRKKKEKLYRFLLAKGYSSSDIMAFIRKSETLFLSGSP